MLAHNPTRPPDLYLTNHLINMYAKCGHLDCAYQLFDEMPHRNIVSWTALISGYAQHGLIESCFRIFKDLLTHQYPTEFALASVVGSCNDICGRQVHGLALKLSIDSYVQVSNALISMYSNCLRDSEAWAIFKSMEFRNLITWNSMLAGCQIRGSWDQAIDLFTQMHINGIGFDRVTLLSVLSSLCSGSDFDLGLGYCFLIHCLLIKTGFGLGTEVATALVNAYSNLEADADDCYKLFYEMSGTRDVVSWTAIIRAYAERNPQEALFLFCQLLQQGIAPDPHTFSTVLKACAGLLSHKHSLSIHSQVIKSGFEDDTVLSNALIHAYSRCGSLAFSEQVFNSMSCCDLVSWNSILKAYALHGQAETALWVFSQMDVQPDASTFVALLSACSHAGLVDEGARLFDSMFEVYGTAPQLSHFACMVDMLGRDGRITEAEKVIRSMPMEPDSVVWSALLGACRKHNETRLAQLAAEKLRELEPDNSLGYVLMSNIYCLGGSFKEAGHVRKEMKGFRVRKEPGLSFVDIGNWVHEFASGGRFHPQKEAIYAKLEGLLGRLKEMGYVPETNMAMYDIEEENKEEQLYYHSEKLALVFALMNSANDGGVIRIMKNIRICVDCHNFMKLTSSLIRREVIVRDLNRFHCFQDGLCSCNDYW